MIYKTIKPFILPQIIYLLWVNMPRVSDSPFSLYFTSKGWFGSSVCFWLKKKKNPTKNNNNKKQYVWATNYIPPTFICICWLICLLCVSSIRPWALREHFVYKFIVWCLMNSIVYFQTNFTEWKWSLGQETLLHQSLLYAHETGNSRETMHAHMLVHWTVMNISCIIRVFINTINKNVSSLLKWVLWKLN